MFDVLTYQKGGSVLRMLEQFIGPEVFRDGIRDYLERPRLRQHRDPRPVGRPRALERPAGRPDHGHLDRPGRLPAGDRGRRGASPQQPFSYRGDPGGRHRARVAGAGARTARSGSTDDRADAGTALTARRHGRRPGPPRTGGQRRWIGRTSGSPTTPTHVGRLAGRLGELAPLERYNLVSDAWAAVLAGPPRSPTFSGWPGPSSTPARRTRASGRWWSGPSASSTGSCPTRPAGPGRGRSAPCSAPWPPASAGRPRPEDDERTPTLRASVLRALGTIGADAAVRAEAAAPTLRRGRAPRPIHSDIESAVLAIVAADGGAGEFEAFLARYRSPATPQEEDRYLYALAGFPRAGRWPPRTFDLAMTEVRSQDAPFLICVLVANRGRARRLGPGHRGVGHPGGKFPSNTLPRMLDGVRTLCWPPGLADRGDRLRHRPTRCPPVAARSSRSSSAWRSAWRSASARRTGLADLHRRARTWADRWPRAAACPPRCRRTAQSLTWPVQLRGSSSASSPSIFVAELPGQDDDRHPDHGQPVPAGAGLDRGHGRLRRPRHRGRAWPGGSSRCSPTAGWRRSPPCSSPAGRPTCSSCPRRTRRRRGEQEVEAAPVGSEAIGHRLRGHLRRRVRRPHPDPDGQPGRQVPPAAGRCSSAPSPRWRPWPPSGAFGRRALLRVLPLAVIRKAGGVLLAGFAVYTLVGARPRVIVAAPG